VIDYGFNAKFEDRDQCVRNITGACSTSFNRTRLANDIESSCLGKKSCKLTALKSYVTSNQKVCTDDDASFYMQFYCLHSKEELGQKRNEGTIVAGIAVFSCLFFVIMIFYLRQSTQIQKTVWDVETITAGDYAVDMTLTRT
jgi:hypothetical protein